MLISGYAGIKEFNILYIPGKIYHVIQFCFFTSACIRYKLFFVKEN